MGFWGAFEEGWKWYLGQLFCVEKLEKIACGLIKDLSLVQKEKKKKVIWWKIYWNTIWLTEFHVRLFFVLTKLQTWGVVQLFQAMNLSNFLKISVLSIA